MDLKIYAKVPQFKFDRGPLREALRRELELVKQDYESTVVTWEEHKPTFEIDMKSGNQYQESGQIIVHEAGDKPIYKYIDEGTEESYAYFTRKFEAKTTPSDLTSAASLRAGPGKGKFTHLGEPHSGIKGRKFTRRIAKRHRDMFRRRIKNIRAQQLIRKSGIRTVGSIHN